VNPDKLFDSFFTLMFAFLFLFMAFGLANLLFGGITYKLMITFGSLAFFFFMGFLILGLLEKAGAFDGAKSETKERPKLHEMIMYIGGIVAFAGLLLLPSIFAVVPILYVLYLFGIMSPFEIVSKNPLWVVGVPFLLMFAGFIIFCLGMIIEHVRGG